MGKFQQNNLKVIMPVDFISLNLLSQLDEIVELSENTDNKAVAIFKHSTRCSISSMALNRLTRSWDITSETLPIFFLDLISYRNISNEIADRFDVEHESPQLLIIKNGKCVYHASHSAIDVDDIKALEILN